MRYYFSFTRVLSYSFVFVLFASLSARANETVCVTGASDPRPDWINSFGSNEETLKIYGYSQFGPKAGQTREQFVQNLKNAAIGDLTLNIRTDVKSSIETSQRFSDGEEVSSADINYSAESQLSLGLLSGTNIFIDENKCLGFARVGMDRQDLPFVLAWSDIKSFEDQVRTQSLDLRSLQSFSKLLQALEESSKNSNSTIGQYNSRQPELERIIVSVKNEEIRIRLGDLENLSGSLSYKRKQLNRLSELLNDVSKARDLSEIEETKKQEISEQLDEIGSVVGGSAAALGWSTLSPSLDRKLMGFVEANKAKYWSEGSGEDKDSVVSVMKDYDLDSGLFLDLSLTRSKKFGIEEVSISIEIKRLGEDLREKPGAKILKTKAVGRKVNEEIIASKIFAVVSPEL